MRPGLRLRIVLLLGALLVLAFVPLFFAVATYSRLALQQAQQAHARTLGRAVAGHVTEARARRSTREMMDLLDAEIGTAGVTAVGVYDADGKPVARVGDPLAVDALARPVDPKREEVFEVTSRHGRALAVQVPGDQGAVIAVLRIDDQAARAAPLVRLVGLYTALVALALLIAAYFLLTRMIVRPLDQLTAAAQRVAGGARRFDVPASSVRELDDLGSSLRSMTAALIAEEEKLRAKIDEVERATRNLEQAQDRLVRSERLASVGRLAAGLAHEIGNPISALIGMQDLIIDGGLNEDEQRDFVERMRKETERINRILRDLLQFARPGSRPQGEPGAGNVEAAIHDTAALVHPQSAMKDVALELDVHPELPEVALPYEHLVQVVLNLVLNAADACGPGGRVTLRASGQGEGVRIEVEDDGPGVSPDVREQLFEPFVTTKDVGKGTGLGLAVCRGLVEAVGGSIALDEGYADGARFVIELPASEA